MVNQVELLKAMEKDFGITRQIFLNLKTGWYDNSKGKSNLVFAKHITLGQIQGRYRLNLADSTLGIQEFFFDLEWSPYSEDGKEIKVVTNQITDKYFLRLKLAAKRLLFPVMRYIPKRFIYIRASGTGIHIIFFLHGLLSVSEWELITKYFIFKSKLKNTKNSYRLVFGLDKDTVLSSERKIAEFGSWNKLKKDFKQEVNYLNYATYLSVDEFFKANHYPFCPDFMSVKYPEKYEYHEVSKRLLNDAKKIITESTEESQLSTNKMYSAKSPNLAIASDSSEERQIVEFSGTIPENDPAYQLVKNCKCYWNMLRDANATWYARQFVVKYLKYVLKLDREEILELIHKYNGWSDYNPRITAFYVNKHFRKGTCETKVEKPPRKKTLIKFGLCDNKCDNCIYSCFKKMS